MIICMPLARILVHLHRVVMILTATVLTEVEEDSVSIKSSISTESIQPKEWLM